MSFLRWTAGQIEREQRSVGHGGCGVALIREALCVTANRYVNLVTCATAVRVLLTPNA